MAKGSNNGKPRKAHNFKPYDTANSSFVKRITTRVSEILPQPSTWISRWLTPAAAQPDLRNDSEDDDDEEEQRQPARKRPCLLNTTPDFTQQNHISRTRLEEISPILRRTDHDKAVPGPSGLHLSKKTNFVFSTPASTQTQEPKVNGDEESDSESTSGCSSLVPQGEKASFAMAPKVRPPLPSTPTNAPSASPSPTPSIASSSKMPSRPSKFPKLMNTSRPSFDSYVFNNPLSKSLSSNTSGRLNDSSLSPFYKGRTMYGGASSYREALDSSLISSRVGAPKVVTVKPSSTPNASKERISTTATRILKALEQFSTPIAVPKKVVGRESEKRKRKPLPPYEEHVIPEMSVLLRIKRKEQPPQVPKSTSQNNPVEEAQPPPTPQPEKFPERLISIPEPEENSLVKCIRGRKNEDLHLEKATPLSLPDVKLTIKTLPKFTFESLPKRSNPAPKRPSETLLALPSKDSKFVFSKPIFETPDCVEIESIKPSIKFSEPLDANANEKIPDKMESPLTTKPSLPKGLLYFKPQTKLKEKDTANLITTTDLKNPFGWECNIDTCREFNSFASTECTACQAPSPESKEKKEGKPNVITLTDLTFIKPFGWECNIDTCRVYNTPDATECTACQAPAPKSKEKKERKPNVITLTDLTFIKPFGWECSIDTCRVYNTPDATECTACEAPAPKSKGKTKNKPNVITITALGAQPFGWECNIDTCRVYNTPDATECIACEAPAPKSKEKTKNNKWECKNCKLENSETDTCKSCSTDKDGVLSFPLAKGLQNFIKSNENTWECSACLVRNKEGESICIACATPKEGSSSKKEDKPLSSLFKKPEGNWDCEVCLVSNKNNVELCVACSTPKPGATNTQKQETPKFEFGIPQSVSGGGFNLTQLPVTNEAPKVNFSFGIPKPNEEKTEFKFGIPKEPDVENKEEKPVTSEPKPKKRVSFGDPLVEEKIITDDNQDKVKEDNPEPPKTNAVFKFGVPTTENDQNIFGSVLNSTEKSVFSSFTENKVAFGESKPFVDGFSSKENISIFGNPAKKEDIEKSETSNSVQGEEKKEETTVSLAFGSENLDSIFGKPSMPEEKLFNAKPFPPPPVEDKKPFAFALKSTFNNSNNVFSNKVDNAPAFGAQSKPFTFNATNQKTFGFFNKEEQHKPSGGGFNFAHAPSNQVQSNAFNFQHEPPKSVFNAPPNPSVFNQVNPAPANPLFLFGSSHQEQQKPIFGAQPVQAPSFFGSQNSTPSQIAPAVQPPVFEPNRKPTFNFSTGVTPSFTATAAPLSASGEGGERKIKRALRRTR